MLVIKFYYFAPASQQKKKHFIFMNSTSNCSQGNLKVLDAVASQSGLSAVQHAGHTILHQIKLKY